MNEIALAKIVLAILTELGKWEVSALLLLLFFLPPMIFAWLLWRLVKAQMGLSINLQEQSRAQNQRFEAVVTLSENHFAAFNSKYDNNVKLVNDYEKLASDLSTVIHLNTQAMTVLVERIKGMREK